MKLVACWFEKERLSVSSFFSVSCFLHFPVADPGFSRGGCTHSQIGIILSIFCRKLHENERMWTPGERVPGAPLRSANAFFLLIFVDPETPGIRISLCIRIRFWMVSEGLLRPYIAEGWCQKTFRHHPN